MQSNRSALCSLVSWQVKSLSSINGAMPGQKAKLSGMAVLIGNLMALQPVRGLFAGAAFLVLYELHLFSSN